MARCRECNANISGDELGLNFKLIDRNATDFLCIKCMSAHFSCGEDALKSKIRYYKEIGCKLFPPAADDEYC